MGAAILLLAGALSVSTPPDGHSSTLPSCHAAGIIAPQAVGEPDQARYYPPEAIRRNQEGSVLVGFDIDESGKVVNGKVVQSSGYESLDNAALASTSARTFKPATAGGKPVACHNEIRMVWKLTGGENPVVNMKEMGPDDYPATAKANGEQGTAYVMVVIDENGNITNSVVVKSSGFRDLDAASLDWVYAVRQVQPARLSGRAVKSSVLIGFQWTLNTAATH